MTLKKILAPLALMAAFALVAMSLIAQSGTASAAVNGLSLAPATVNPSDLVTLTIDADDTLNAGAGHVDVRVLATAGDFETCNAGGACILAAGSIGAGLPNDIDFTVDDSAADAGGNVDTISVGWRAPSTGPQTVTFTVIQGSSTKTATVTVRGTANTVEVSALNAASTSTSTCVGTVSQVIRSTTATTGQATSTLCARVLDSAGNRLPAQAVVYSTTDGTITPLTDTTGATGQNANASILTAGTTGLSGDTATITASAGGKTATTTVKFGGDPASCTVTTNPTTVAVGGAATVNVEVKDSASGPVPDGAVINVAQVNPGQGANAAILNPAPTTLNGTAQTTAIAAISGAIYLGATSAVQNPGATCTGTLIATGTVVPPVGGGGDGEFTGDIASSGVSLVVFGGGSVDDLADAADAVDAVSISLTVDGDFVVYIVGAPDFVNEAFVDEFSGGIAAGTPVILFVG